MVTMAARRERGNARAMAATGEAFQMSTAPTRIRDSAVKRAVW
jgi:hypothetical protein